MDQIIQHKNLYDNWKTKPIAFQMANIGSEVSRSLKNQDKPARFQGAYERALELFDFTIDAAVENQAYPALKEICRAREEFCDYFNGNSLNTDPSKMQRYYDQFATIL